MTERELKLVSILESLLFVCGEPMSVEKLSKVTGRSKEEIEDAVQELKKGLEDRGVVLIEKEDRIQLGTRPEHAEYVERLIKSDFSEELSRAAVETIAIIAYKGPISRADIEYVRGVNSSFTLRNLMLRGLIERVENPKDARAYLYKVSFEFLQHLGYTKIDEFPGFEEFRARAIEIFEEKQTDASQMEGNTA